ncbi:MAG: hypothetical protein ACTHLR_05800 [Rhizomicrobium sp.]
MIAGLSTATFTLVHVAITFVAIASGLVVLYGLLKARRMEGWTDLFLAFTALTDVTSFMFPFHGLTPAFNLAIVSSLVLLPTLAARYAFSMAGQWRGVYVAGAVLSLYLNCFVLVAQSFDKIAALHSIAPNGSEPPFLVVQGVVLFLFLFAGLVAFRRFRPIG